MGIQIIKGSRSERFAAKDWSCVCGTANKAKSFLFFDLPPFTCENRQCGRVYDGIIYFNLADIEVNGKSLLPGIKSQGQRPECIPYAFGHAQELNDIVENIILGDDSPIEVIDPMILAETYRMMFGPHINNLENPGAHKILYTALILKDYGRKAVKDKLRSTRSDAVTVNSSKAEHICQCIADGRAVVATIAVGKHLRHLKFGEVYVPPETKYDTLGHAVVLIGAIFHQLRIIYFFLNSWGEQFCAFYDENGKLVMSGVGMVEGKFLMYNPVVLTRSWEEGTINGLFGSWMWYETASEREVDVDCIMETPNLMPTFTRKKFDVCAYDDESLKYRLLGSEEDFGSWGHEYARNLAGKIAQEFQKRQDDDLPIDALMELMQKFVSFQKHNAETEAVDLLMEVEDLDLLVEHVDATNYKRACLYLSSLSRYLPAPDDMLALDIAYTIYMKFGDLVIALIIALQLDKLLQYVKQVFTTTDDLLLKKQFAHVIARHGLALEIDDEIAADDNDKEILQEIVNNTKLSEGYLTLARDIEVMEPKSPEDMYKVNVMGTLSRLSHGADADVSMAAIISLGLIGAGTNNARIAGMLRDLSSYYYKEAAHLFC